MRTKPMLIRAMQLDNEGKPLGLKTVNMADLKSDWTPKRDSLTADQWRRIAAVYDVIGRYATTWKREEWVDSFRSYRDPHLENEIGVWERIVRTFKAVRPSCKTAQEKKIIANAIIMITTQAVDISAHTGLTDEQVDNLRTLHYSTVNGEYYGNP